MSNSTCQIQPSKQQLGALEEFWGNGWFPRDSKNLIDDLVRRYGADQKPLFDGLKSAYLSEDWRSCVTHMANLLVLSMLEAKTLSDHLAKIEELAVGDITKLDPADVHYY